MPVIEDVVVSPCVRVCTLDDDDVCLGCGRTLAEIKAWGGSDPDGRREILKSAEARMIAFEEKRQASGRRW